MNPLLGVVYHWLGGLASGSFYVPYKGVKKWSWEVYWLVGGFFSWIICPWVLASLLTNDVVGVLRQQSATTLWWTYFFGAMWGFGGLTFGLTMRYLGMSLGMGVALGYCAAFGTLLPPIFKTFIPTIPVAETIGQIASTTPGKVTLFGVLVCLIGIGVAAMAGALQMLAGGTTRTNPTRAGAPFVAGMASWHKVCIISSDDGIPAKTSNFPSGATSDFPLYFQAHRRTGCPVVCAFDWGLQPNQRAGLVYNRIIFRK